MKSMVVCMLDISPSMRSMCTSNSIDSNRSTASEDTSKLIIGKSFFANIVSECMMRSKTTEFCLLTGGGSTDNFLNAQLEGTYKTGLCNMYVHIYAFMYANMYLCKYACLYEYVYKLGNYYSIIYLLVSIV